MRNPGLLLAAVLALSACALRPAADDSALERSVHLDLVRGMMARDQYYAALAHIQEQRVKGYDEPDLRLLEAQALRNLKRDKESEVQYRKLLTGPLAAEAHHGLGLLYAPRDAAQSLANLRRAVQLQPSSAAFRNDLGYALMLGRRYAEALPEFATAVELEPARTQSVNNLILLLILTKDEAGVRRVATQSGIANDRLVELRQQARSLENPAPRAPPRRSS